MSPNPTILIGAAGTVTNQIKIGTGGILIKNHSILSVLENTAMLETLFPGRILIGIGRADGMNPHLLSHSVFSSEYTPPLTLEALDEKMITLLRCSDPIQQQPISPRLKQFPPITILGSSKRAALFAAKQKRAFNLAHFINPKSTDEIIATYRDNFASTIDESQEPELTLAVHAICADKDNEAEQLAKILFYCYLQLQQQHDPILYSLKEMENIQFSQEQKKRFHRFIENHFIGSPTTIKEKLNHFIQQHDPQNILFTTGIPDFKQRCHSYKLLSELLKQR